jgi:hypothetical protein
MAGPVTESLAVAEKVASVRRAPLRPKPNAATSQPSRQGKLARYRVCLYFLLGLAALDFVIAANRATWRSYDPDDYAERVANCRRHTPDLLVIGGSPVSEGIDPAPLAGIDWHGQQLESAYNLGLPGGTTSDLWLALQHGLQRPPRLLVYGITATDLNEGRQQPKGPRSLMDFGDLVDWVRCRPDSASFMVRHYLRAKLASAWQLYRYRYALRLWAAAQADRCWPGAFLEVVEEADANRNYAAAMHRSDGFAPQPDGQIRQLDILKAQGNHHPVFEFFKDYHLGGHLAYLHRILDWAEASGVSVVLVDMPVTAELDEQRFPREFAVYRAALVQLEKDRHVTVLRASRQTLALEDAHFADWIHLNGRGGARLGAWLRQQLTALGQEALR